MGREPLESLRMDTDPKIAIGMECNGCTLRVLQSKLKVEQLRLGVGPESDSPVELFF